VKFLQASLFAVWAVAQLTCPGLAKGEALEYGSEEREGLVWLVGKVIGSLVEGNPSVMVQLTDSWVLQEERCDERFGGHLFPPAPRARTSKIPSLVQ
jgi:hypothetical protein